MTNLIFLPRVLLAAMVLTLSACSTIRDTTDWVPGVASNEEIKAAELQKKREAMALEREAYADKGAFAPISRSASEADARISVLISQKYAASKIINAEDIGIEVNAGVVTLTGNVPSNDSAILAISTAKTTQGVSRVISKLVVVKLRKKK